MTLPIEEAIIIAKAHLDEVMGSGRYTLGFVVDLAMTLTQRQRSIFRIVEEVAVLEGTSGKASSTKPESQFEREQLLGYWHKHYADASFMPKNVLNEMRRDHTVPRVLAPHVGEPITESLLSELARVIVHDNYLRKMQEGRLTGEWIVFSKAAGSNYYITLAEHREANTDKAERIHRYEEVDRQMDWISRRGHGIIFPKAK